MEKLLVYTDGSSKGNGASNSKCGWAYKIMRSDETVIEKNSGGDKGKTNNRMEMFAVLKALQAISDKSAYIELYSDSNNIVESMKGNYHKNTNLDLWKELEQEKNKFSNIRFIWVKAHEKNQHNNEVDKMAQAEADKIKYEGE